MNQNTPKTHRSAVKPKTRKVPDSRKNQTPLTTWLPNKTAKTIKKVGKQNRRSFAGQSAFVLEEYARDMADVG